MTRDHLTYPSGVRYTGPLTEAHLAGWRRLCESVTGGGRWPFEIEHLNRLNDLAFGTDTLDHLVTGIPGGERGYWAAKSGAEDVAAISSHLAARHPSYQPLHHALTSALANRWDAHRGPDRTAGRKGHPAGEELLTKPPAALLYGVIRMAHDFTVRTHTERALRWTNRVRLRIDEGEVAHVAEGLFRQALMSYDPKKGSLNNVLMETLTRFLAKTTGMRASKFGRLVTGLEPGLDGTDWAESLEERPATDQEAGADRRETGSHVRMALSQLKPSHRELLEQRFGLDGNKPRSLESIAQTQNVSREAIRLRQKTAMKSLKELLYPPDNNPPGGVRGR
jgi:hypothetical protein